MLLNRYQGLFLGFRLASPTSQYRPKRLLNEFQGFWGAQAISTRLSACRYHVLESKRAQRPLGEQWFVKQRRRGSLHPRSVTPVCSWGDFGSQHCLQQAPVQRRKQQLVPLSCPVHRISLGDPYGSTLPDNGNYVTYSPVKSTLRILFALATIHPRVAPALSNRRYLHPKQARECDIGEVNFFPEILTPFPWWYCDY